MAEVLPAVMEAYYTGQPLLIISADRPERFRGSGAPQSCTQPGIFGIYAPFVEDLTTQPSSLRNWDQKSPAHINVCFEEPKDLPGKPLIKNTPSTPPKQYCNDPQYLDQFLAKTTTPLVIVGELADYDRDSVEEFLLKLNAPVVLEPPSGLCGRSALKSLIVQRRRNILKTYSVDGVLRIGGVPTLRLWRDLENLSGEIPVLTLSRWPFSGLSFDQSIPVAIDSFLENYSLKKAFSVQHTPYDIEPLYQQFPNAEQTLIHELSQKLTFKHSLYLGNSLPIRHWDSFATTHDEEISIAVNRGINGIDGQLSTALGFADESEECWIVLGDLTTLYDLSAPWFLKQRKLNVQIVVVNNSGGQIFSEMFQNPSFINQHSIQFDAFAAMWNLKYERWNTIPSDIRSSNSRIIELVPDATQTKGFSSTT